MKESFDVFLIGSGEDELIGSVVDCAEFFRLLDNHMNKNNYSGYFRIIGPVTEGPNAGNYIIDYGSHTKFLKVSEKLNLLKGNR